MGSEDVLRALEDSKRALLKERRINLVAALDEVEAVLGRALESDELVSAGRALRTGLAVELVAEMFVERPADIPDASVKVHAAVLEGRQFREL